MHVDRKMESNKMKKLNKNKKSTNKIFKNQLKKNNYFINYIETFILNLNIFKIIFEFGLTHD